MHFCKFNLSFVGLGYKTLNSITEYEFVTFELYKCNKCGKLVFLNQQKQTHTSLEDYSYAIANSKNCGYRLLSDLAE